MRLRVGKEDYMTGRDIMLFILSNHLEDEVIFGNLELSSLFMTVEEAAAKFHVGIASINIWCNSGWLPYYSKDATRYILKTAEDPREKR